MESIKTWLFGKQESAVQEAMPSLSTAQENMLQGEEKDDMCKNQSKGTPTNLDNSLSSSIDSHINLTGTIETVPEIQENVNLAKDAENHKVFRTSLLTICFFSVYKHAAYATRKLGITQRHLKALKTLFIGVWSHYMLLEYYLPSVVKYGPDGEILPQDVDASMKYLTDKIKSVNINRNNIRKSVVESEKSLQTDHGHQES
ncbi:uncharacterized protein LOC128209076 [Mya arenaria]|uniref:uncharacterized protein LOC128209076 n=1 Tax=Mya arenaria TaxID=6604 RepID=UPI0022E601E0|nr:uncharacterized protein LOC128209076 [Mya arenaria]XP_052768878.1 uncharacterized protein LOC128209076 [Mya arenaria]XP_052768879.1 uncharacterized protein LOC128209076 [Mya arenaria]